MNMNIPDYNILSKPGINRNRLKKEYVEFLRYLDETYSESLGFTEKLYWYIHNIKETPKCTCGKPLKFRSLKIGYSEFCSAKCSNSNPEKIEKTKNTCQERYRSSSPAGNKDIRDKMRKTCLEKYGVENYLKISHRTGSLSEESKQKMKETCMERYGVDNVMKLPEYQDIVNGNKDYKELSKKAQEARKNQIINKNPDIISITDGLWTCRCPHPNCTKCDKKSYEITAQMYHDRRRDHTEPCTILLAPSPNNNKNTSLEIFVQNLLEGHNIEYIANDRSILGGKELDIYIPDRKIAIECNGVFSHSSRYKPRNYHYEKYKACSERNIRLISIWEDWVRNKPEIVRSLILSKLNIYENHIMARKCEVKEINSKITGKFLEENHIQGKTSSNIHLGLYYKNELVAVMLFGKKRMCSGNNKTAGWDLSRFCTKRNICVIGGAGKLLSYFIKRWSPDMIYSFASCDISNGNLYKSLGFVNIGHSSSYWYINERTLQRYHRSSFTKKSLIKRNWTDGTETETDVMNNHGFLQIYDSGTEKWILKII